MQLKNPNTVLRKYFKVIYNINYIALIVLTPPTHTKETSVCYIILLQNMLHNIAYIFIKRKIKCIN